MRYKTHLIIILLIAFSLTACRRDSRQSTDTASPIQTGNAQTGAVQPTAESATSTDAAPLPPPMPSLTPIPATQEPDLSSDLSELDDILNDLDKILGGTNTDVNIP